MKFGRNFTNTLIAEVLDPQKREQVISGEIDLFSLNALGIMDFKKDVLFQIDAIKKLGFNWLELDCDVPNPYLDFSDDDCRIIKDKADENGVELSVHLSYSGVGKEVSNIQNYERNLVVNMHKKYLDFAGRIGAKTCVLHPGTAPFYFLSPVFLEKIENSLVETLNTLIPYAKEKSIVFHLENNVSFDNIYWQIDDLVRVIEKVRAQGHELYFNFDIGHWFTMAEKGQDIPENFLDTVSKIPPELVYEIHLNDYVPKKIIFHPPLLDTPGLLTKDVLKEYLMILKNKLKPEVIVLETAFKTKEQIAKRWELLEQETGYIRELWD